MSVEYITGNLLDFPGGCNIIAHIVNMQGVMGSGVALQIKEEYPVAYEEYKKAFESGNLKLGTISVGTLNNGKKILNICAQEFYGTEKRQLDYEAFYAAFENIRNKLEESHNKGKIWTLGVPYKIGSDRAGASWRVIETMLLDLFENSPAKLLIVQLPNTQG